MSRVRKILRNPLGTNYYLIDASFLANRYIPVQKLPQLEKERVEKSLKWWGEINDQLQRGKAIVYIPDVCIAEAFKVLAKKYYRERVFANVADYYQTRKRFSRDIQISVKQLKSANRLIKFHDISTSRDVIISVDRFLEFYMKHNLNVSVPDLIILATAKYLIDFFRIPFESLFIVSLDEAVCFGSKKIPDIPGAFNPTARNETAEKVFQ